MTGESTVLTELIRAPVSAVLSSMLAGVICLITPRRAERARIAIALLATVLTVVLTWQLFADGGEPRLAIGAWRVLRIDALSTFVALAVSVFGLLVAIYSAGYMRGRDRHREYFAYLLWTVGAALVAVYASDLIVFLGGWGFLALTLYLMVGIAGPGAAEAARKSCMIVAGSDALLVFGVVLLWMSTGTTRMDVAAVPLTGVTAHLAFLMFVIAALAKAGAVPFQSWVADCGEKADAPVTAFLPASLDKLLGIYFLARAVLQMFQITPVVRTMLMALGALTVIAAVLMALVQRDLKRLLAYHAVSQVGYMVLGIASGTAIGVAGGLFHMLNHAIYKCCLFLGAGSVEKATGTSDLDRLGGLGRSMPLTFAAFAVSAFAISGIPPLNGFASKWMVYQGLITMSDTGGPGWIVWLVAAMLGSALTLASFVKVLHAVFLCKPAPNIARRTIREASYSMVVPMLLLAGLCIVFGVFANAIPLRWLIFPVVPAVAPGAWWSGLATVLILVAVAIGGIVYAITMRAGRLRRTETYIGGERLQEVHVHGEPPGASRHLEVTGVDFYHTIEQLPALRRLYALAARKLFDIYHVLGKSVSYFVAALSAAHNGVLPLYLTWFLVGIVAVVYAVAQSGP